MARGIVRSYRKDGAEGGSIHLTETGPHFIGVHFTDVVHVGNARARLENCKVTGALRSYLGPDHK